MLFNSYPFIFLFLPVALLGYFALGRLSNLFPVIWLALASLAFYAVSNWQFVPLLLASVAFNYLIGLLLIAGRLRAVLRLAVLTLGVTGDLVVLGIFKYAGFFRRQLQCDLCNQLHGRDPASGRDFVLHLHPGRILGR